MDKVYQKIEDAIADVNDGAMIAVAGFFACGVPRLLLRALIDKGTKNLTLTCGCGPMLGASEELNQLVKNKQLKKVIDSYGLYRSATKGKEDPFEQAIRAGELELEVYPMGTLAEKYRAAAAGVPAIYLPTGVGSVVEQSTVTNIPENRIPKETRAFNGKTYVLELALKPDFAFVHAHTGDREGNLKYIKTARNFNPVMAAAAKVTIAEVENMVEPGVIDPDCIHTAGIYVKRVVPVPRIDFKVSID
ncbi:MAG: CoA transferase subunit A [Dehalococcoidales bacterium]|nr:CoA transferase subunit A [Dehalococcoidales bacterium]